MRIARLQNADFLLSFASIDNFEVYFIYFTSFNIREFNLFRFKIKEVKIFVAQAKLPLFTLND